MAIKDKRENHPWYVELEDISVPEIITDQNRVGLAKMQLDALKIRTLMSIDEKLGELLIHLKGEK
jgi:hypothetical protein